MFEKDKIDFAFQCVDSNQPFGYTFLEHFLTFGRKKNWPTYCTCWLKHENTRIAMYDYIYMWVKSLWIKTFRFWFFFEASTNLRHQ